MISYKQIIRIILIFFISFTACLSCSEKSNKPLGNAAINNNDKNTNFINHKKTRKYTFRALIGTSMGASAMQIGLKHPELFDVIGGQGGYHDFVYMLHMLWRFHFSGFCNYEQLISNIEHLNNPDNNKVNCQNTLQPTEFEWEQKFNDWHSFTNGGTFNRDTIIQAIEDISLAFGNMFSYNPDSPFLPPGVPFEHYELSNIEKCANPVTLVDENRVYNAEYNPDGTYPVITFCDGEESIENGKDNPNWYELAGAYDPDITHDLPVSYIMAVDYNKNGLRDYGEPLIINAFERYSDFGIDGIPSEQENGYDSVTNPDPENDDYHYLTNPNGTENNRLWNEGEPFDDSGLDGVAGTLDYGEEDLLFNYSPNIENYFFHDSYHNLLKLSDEELDSLDIWLDAGRYDGFHAAELANHFFGALLNRTENAKIYDTFNSLMTENDDFDFEKVNYSSLLKHVYLRYGNPDASLQEIQNGDGAHVGTTKQALNRILSSFAFISSRFPKGYQGSKDDQNPGIIKLETFYSESLKTKRQYGIALPPGYKDKNESSISYPVVYYFHGLGMDPEGTIGSGDVIHLFMSGTEDNPSIMQKMIIVYVDGRCCYKNKETQKRNCLGYDENNNKLNMEIWKKECNDGCFYHSTKGIDNNIVPFEQSFIELINHIDENYNTKETESIKISN